MAKNLMDENPEDCGMPSFGSRVTLVNQGPSGDESSSSAHALSLVTPGPSGDTSGIPHRKQDVTVPEESLAQMSNMPDDILLKIFSMLEPKDLLITVRLTCKKWHEVGQDWSLWRNFDFFKILDGQNDAQFLSIAQYARGIKELAPMNDNMTVSTLCEGLQYMPDLENFHTPKLYKLEDLHAMLSSLAINCAKLSDFHIFIECQLDITCIYLLRKMQNLRSLSFTSAILGLFQEDTEPFYISDVVMSAIATLLTGMREFRVHSYTGFTDYCLKTLRKLNLNELYFTWGKTMTIKGIKHLAKMTDLQVIGLSFETPLILTIPGFEDECDAVQHILKTVAERCPNLIGFELEGNDYVTDDAILFLVKGMTKLKRLSFWMQDLTDKMLIYIAMYCLHLEELAFLDCTFLSEKVFFQLLEDRKHTLKMLRMGGAPLDGESNLDLARSIRKCYPLLRIEAYDVCTDLYSSSTDNDSDWITTSSDDSNNSDDWGCFL